MSKLQDLAAERLRVALRAAMDSSVGLPEKEALDVALEVATEWRDRRGELDDEDEDT